VQICKKLQLLGDFVPQSTCWGYAPGPHWETPVPKPPDWPVFILGLFGGNPPKIQTLQNNSTRPKNQRHEFMAG